MKRTKCKMCGKAFATKNMKRKYCCKKCRMEARENKGDGRGQLCWMCKMATGGCSWSKSYKPIPGWKAKATIVKDSEGDFSSYRIISCPEFVDGRCGMA